MTWHELKTWPEFFEAVRDGRKPFEYRFNDRDYQVGDGLHLREWAPLIDDDRPEDANFGTYTGRDLARIVTFVMPVTELGPSARFRAQPGPGYVVMALRELRPDEGRP